MSNLAEPQALGTKRIRPTQLPGLSVEAFTQAVEADLASLIADYWPQDLPNDVLDSFVKKESVRLVENLRTHSPMNRAEEVTDA